ncbi:MAG: cobalt-precorrin-6A reductase [Pseudomonadota bacterium]
MTKLLILGGTAEARALLGAVSEWPDLHAVMSFAGRTRHPNIDQGVLRLGGFGGVDGLASYLRDESIDVLIDATHPFAARMSMQAEEASNRTGIPRLKLLRPPWAKHPKDRWIDVSNAEEAARRLPGLARRVFLTTGHRDLEYFSNLNDIWFLIRTIEPIEQRLPNQACCIQARGPFSEKNEIALLNEYGIDALVTKASGGRLTYAKVAAARALDLPVVMIQRPKPPPGPIVPTVDDALAWLRQDERAA